MMLAGRKPRWARSIEHCERSSAISRTERLTGFESPVQRAVRSTRIRTISMLRRPPLKQTKAPVAVNNRQSGANEVCVSFVFPA